MSNTNPTFIVAGLAFLLVASPVAAAAATGPSAMGVFGADTLGPSALDRPDDTILRHGQPSWVVELDNESDASKLEDWAMSSEQRHLIEAPSDGYAVVAASPTAIGTGLADRLLNNGLAARNYVSSIEPEITVPVPEVELTSADGYQAPGDRLTQLNAALGGGTLDASAGLAFAGDYETTSLADSRDAMQTDGVTETGAGTTVAVVDTGASVGDGRVFGDGTAGSDLRISNASKSFVSGESVDVPAGDFAAIDDEGGHGSHVAATIAANHANDSLDGVAPGAELLVLQALDPERGSGDSSNIADAVRYAADQNADVISMSLGAPVYNSQIADAVAYAQEEGSIVTVATGNSRMKGIQFLASPADATEETIAVGAATVEADASTALPASFSQVGPDNGLDLSNGVTEGRTVSVVGPGTAVQAPIYDSRGTLTTKTLSGTSMATPHVSGAIAVLLDADSTLAGDPAAVEERLQSTATRMPNATSAAVGAGYVSLGDAVANTPSEETQADAMTTEATARDAGVETLSDSSGGLFYGVLNSLGLGGD
ncbi:S8 family serine peptidase [Halosegnis longus]|uniref:S8 family serine peptidase n=1 Tax=Halosegnis longus TaxID=2216012 RepID=UPI00129D3E56|nr:S8 family serine peptidase [Halosegnis longus]